MTSLVIRWILFSVSWSCVLTVVWQIYGLRFCHVADFVFHLGVVCVNFLWCLFSLYYFCSVCTVVSMFLSNLVLFHSQLLLPHFLWPPSPVPLSHLSPISLLAQIHLVSKPLPLSQSSIVLHNLSYSCPSFKLLLFLCNYSATLAFVFVCFCDKLNLFFSFKFFLLVCIPGTDPNYIVWRLFFVWVCVYGNMLQLLYSTCCTVLSKNFCKFIYILYVYKFITLFIITNVLDNKHILI